VTGCTDRPDGPGSPPTDRDDTITRIIRVRRQMALLLAFDRANPLMTANFTMSQLRLLMELARARGGAPGHDLSAALGVGLATITGIVDRLAHQGLVSRREDPTDRRVRLVELTPAGQELIDGVISAGTSRQRRLLERLDEEGLTTVERAFGLMVDAIEAERSDAHESATD
jgi:DNA-binding MarR family transcriptional regulator